MASEKKTTLLPARRVEERYGISPMTIWRWLAHPEIGFPAPIKIGNRNYWFAHELDDFDRRQPRRRHRDGGTE